MQSVSQQDKTVLFFSDLAEKTMQVDLEKFLSPYRENIILLNLDQRSQTHEFKRPLTAKVICRDHEIANKIRLEKNLQKIKGHAVRIMWEEKDSSIRLNPKLNLFVKNIPQSITPRQVYEHFIQFGDISSAKVIEEENGNHLGYGYITYYTQEDAEKAIQSSKNEKVWGVNIEVMPFQQKSKRNWNTPQTSALFIKNFPDNFTEKNLFDLCAQYGEIISCNIFTDNYNKRNGNVVYKTEAASKIAIDALRNVNIGGYQLLVKTYQNKYERMQFRENKIRETSSILNEQYQNCNLHIRNIPLNVTENELSAVFEKYGKIISLKIERMILQTNDKDKIKETVISKGFGYICYDNPESARKAIESMGGKLFPGFEAWTRPLLIDYFMPKNERYLVNNQTSLGSAGMFFNQPYIMRNPQVNYQGMEYQRMPMQMPMSSNPHRSNNQERKLQQQQKNQQDNINFDQEHFEKLSSDEEKREYLGERIFMAIQNSKIALNNNLGIDVIGRITGMIIILEDINEVIQTLKDENALEARIQEGLELLKGSE